MLTFRPPYGEINEDIARWIINDNNYTVIRWSRDSFDWANNDIESVTESLDNSAGDCPKTCKGQDWWPWLRWSWLPKSNYAGNDGDILLFHTQFWNKASR